MKKNYFFPRLLSFTFLLLLLFSFTLRAATVNGAPVITVNPYNRTTCESANTYFTIKATNTDAYLWQVSSDGGINWITATGGIYSGETTDTLKLTGAYATAQYRCIVEGGGVKDTSTVASLNFFIVEQTVTPKSTQLCRGDSTTITLGSSQTGINYYLRDGSTTKGPFPGTGSALVMNTGEVFSTKTFSVLAQKSAVGTALQFDGVDDYVKVDKGFPALSTFTFSTFVFPRDLTNGKIISTNAYSLGILNGGIEFKSSSIGNISYNSINKDEWSHITVTYDGSMLRLYINGTEVNAAAATESLPATTSLTIGKDNQTACCYLNAKLDEMRLRTKCLSLAEVREGMTDCIDGTQSDLIAYYRFDDGIGSPFLSDLSGNGGHGTLNNMNNATDWVLGTSACGDNLACSKFMLQTPKITVYALVPEIVSTNPASRCDKGTVVLGATASEGNLSWFLTPTGGTPLATGTTFTTPILNATTSFYVSSTQLGCTSQRKEVIATINPYPDVTVVSNASSITATANENGATYQWLDCKREYFSIPGATTNPYTPTVTGNYAVAISLKGCVDTSKCVSVTVDGIEEELLLNKLVVFPNPSQGIVTIRGSISGTYLIVNELGQTMQSFQLNNANNYTTTIDNLNNGMYMVIGMDNKQQIKQKIIVTR